MTQHQYTKSTTSTTHEADPNSGEEAATEAADTIQAPEEATTTQAIHVATVETHNTDTGQNAKPSELNVIFAIDWDTLPICVEHTQCRTKMK